MAYGSVAGCGDRPHRPATLDLAREFSIAHLRQQAHYYRQAADELAHLADEAERQARTMAREQADVEAAQMEADRELGRDAGRRR